MGSVGRSVIIALGREVTLPCSYEGTRLFINNSHCHSVQFNYVNPIHNLVTMALNKYDENKVPEMGLSTLLSSFANNHLMNETYSCFCFCSNNFGEGLNIYQLES